ncbi:MAG: hypothetical protein QW757_03810 [Candidatus Woesearchaeota archaeon]
MESLEIAKKNAEKDIPLFAKIKKIIYACQWKDIFNYPEDRAIADYYVEYEYTKTWGSIWLIEASTMNLKKEIKQIESSAEFFKEKNINVDGYLIVLDNLSKRSQQLYKLENYLNKPLKIVYEKISYNEKKPYKIYSKNLFVLFRKDFERLKK